MEINNLRVNGNQCPLGYDYDHLSFSWDIAGTSDEKILSQSVQISADPEFGNSIEITQVTAGNLVSIDTKFLEPRKRYFWKVITKTQNAEYAKHSWFETGKLQEAWSASWISYQGLSLDSVVFSKEFSMNRKIKKARLYCCGYGLYECKLNGKHVTEEVLLPGYHSYDLLNQYQTFDVTDYLQNENELSFLTGNGWYKGRFVFEGGYENIYGDKQQIIAELVVEFDDGTHTKIVSDDSWHVQTSCVKKNSIYDGESIDLSRVSRPLTLQILDSGKDMLVERSNPPILRHEPIEPIRAFYDKNNSLVLDFGQIITGWIEGWIDGQLEAKFRFSELMQDDVFYRDNLRTALQEFTVMPSGERTYIRPHFTFYGFRFVEVKGLTMEEAVELKAYPIHSDMEELFFFESDNEQLNQLVENIKWSQKDNFLDIPTDCPQRDERMGWTGDVTIFANASCYNFDTRSFYTHYLKNLRLEQAQLAGSVPFFVPFPKIEPHDGINPFLITDGAAVWGDVATVLPYQLFRHFKDKGLLAQTIETMKSWVEYLYQRDLENGGRHLWDFDRQLGDWLALDNANPQNPIGATDPDLIASVYYYRSVNYLAECLMILQEQAGEKYKQLAQAIKQAILEQYYDDDQLLLEPLTQTGVALLLRNRLYPSKTALNNLKENLIRLLAENKNYLNTGFVGTPEITHALAENGLSELAYTLLLNEECPSWLYEVKQGATTVWERWNSILPNGEISGTEMNSLNHYAYGAIQDFIVEKVVGLRHFIDTNAKSDYTMRLEPCFDSRITWIKGSLKTPNGTIKVSWKWLDSAVVELKVEIPCNTRLLYVDRQKLEKYLGPGNYTFEVQVSK